MLKLSSVALCCAVLVSAAPEAEAKKGGFTRAVGIGVGVGIAKQVMKPKRDKRGKDEQSDADDDDDTSSSASANSWPASGAMATPVANTAPARPQPPAAKPADPVGDGKVVCVAGCYR
jgi:hypothetical protein